MDSTSDISDVYEFTESRNIIHVLCSVVVEYLLKRKKKKGKKERLLHPSIVLFSLDKVRLLHSLLRHSILEFSDHQFAFTP